MKCEECPLPENHPLCRICKEQQGPSIWDPEFWKTFEERIK